MLVPLDLDGRTIDFVDEVVQVEAVDVVDQVVVDYDYTIVVVVAVDVEVDQVERNFHNHRSFSLEEFVHLQVLMEES